MGDSNVMRQLTLGSLFDGIGGWQIAAAHAGVKPIWSSEIEQFPMEVTSKWFPDTKQLGDITKLDGAKLEPVDIICAGSPCQDLSTAGKRKGLAGERSGLFITAINSVRRMREATGGQSPRFFVWENVPGAFSSNKRQDFRAVLEEIGQANIPMPQSGRWGGTGMVRTETCDICWRVLDAQYWGVPQRRKRIFLVADFAKAGRCAAEILFKRESVPRDIAAGEGTRQETTGATKTGACGTDKALTYACKDYSTVGRDAKGVTLRASGGPIGGGSENIVQQGMIDVYDMTHADEVMRPVGGAKVQTLNSRMGTGGNQVPALHIHEANYGIVRRLTPLECERLQGLPDGWTEGGSDTARYKAIGNGMAQPCADFVIRRIVEEVTKQDGDTHNG